MAEARGRLREAGIGIDEAGLDARLLAQHVLGWSAAELLTRSADVPPPDFPSRFASAVHRRARREPLAYIVGVKEFWNLTFEVSPAVLIPRPETELLIEAALEVIPLASTALVADACTGSGCVAVSIATERPTARIVATDTSIDALGVAARNASKYGTRERIELVETDLLTDAAGPFDVILANPPYVPDGDRSTLQQEVRNFEPAAALFAGPDGLELIERLIDQSRSRLKSGGHLIFEFGAGQEQAIRRLISGAADLTMVDIRQDLQRIPRIAIARSSTQQFFKS